MKKTFRIFLSSFILSSSVIWLANELFFSVVPQKSKSIEIPQKSIALFFQNDENIFSAASVGDVKAAKLNAIIKEQQKNDDFNIDYTLFTVESDAPDAISISSIEDAADIPLEYAPAKKKAQKNVQAQNNVIKTKPINTTDLTPKIEEEKNVVRRADTNSVLPEMLPSDKQQNVDENIVAEKTTEVPEEETKILAEAEIIPIEESPAVAENKKIEISESAPINQVAMVDSQSIIGKNAIEQNKTENKDSPKEWENMADENNSPWVVARANVYAKNNKAVEDYANSVNDEEIEKLLNPEKMEEEGEIQTAEMVKNILIPIPEDIMNDKNLTPQLVSPKKSLELSDDVDDVSETKSEEKESTILKSITSIFSSSSDDTEEDGGDKKGKKKKKKGLFAAFDKDKPSSKILPAEMRLAFQPGRAEISGQTLRWIQAFANKAAEDPDIFLEIRIDKNSSYALQQRRLDLLHTILNGKGIGEGKVNTVFTSREPNSFIIRTIRLNNNSQNKPLKKNQRKTSNYQTW